MGLPVFFFDVVHVVGADHLQVEFPRQFQQARYDFPLELKTVIVEFDKIVLLAEDIDELRRYLPGFGIIAVEQVLGGHPVDTPAQPDQTPAVGGQVFHVRAGLVILSLRMRFGNQF